MDHNEDYSPATAGAYTSGNPSEAQVAAWREEHGKLKVVEVDDMRIHFKQPSRKLVELATDTMVRAKGAVSKYNNIILKNCQLSHTKETEADDEIYFALTAKIDDLVTSKVGNLKN